MDHAKRDSHRWPYFLPDGQHFLYLAVSHTKSYDDNDGIYIASLDGKESHRVMKGFANAAYAAGRLLFMRDSMLMAQPFDPKNGHAQWRGREAGGGCALRPPVWRRDGKELFYWTQDNRLMSVPITLRPQGIELGAARMLFRFNRAVGTVGIISPYDVSADGERIVLITTPEAPRPITLVTNWTADLKP
jgi:hypothetical protein